jgi:DNA polymerase IV
MRLLADKKGMHLNGNGLYLLSPGTNNIGVRIAGENELGIFEALGVPFLPPEDRNH